MKWDAFRPKHSQPSNMRRINNTVKLFSLITDGQKSDEYFSASIKMYFIYLVV